MTANAFLPADILLPAGVDMTKWSVIACDQFSSEPAYWDRVEKAVGDNPSTLKLIVPEARLSSVDPVARADAAGAEMEHYIKSGLMRTLSRSFIYLERTLTDGSIRRGLVGMLDLEAYDYRPDSASVVRASEKTILSRLPARMEIRKRAPLELPHIMALIDDASQNVIKTLSARTNRLESVYDFDLLEGGGRVKGWRVEGRECDETTARLASLFSGSSVQIIIGDGNHSLAAAKDYWDALKKTLTGSERDNHPARYALMELCNVYDPAIRFEAIHRLVAGVDPNALILALETGLSGGSGRDYDVRWLSAGGSGTLTVHAESIGGMIKRLQTLLDEYLSQNGGDIDFIHGEDSLRELASADGRVGFLVPGMDKSEFFTTVVSGGVFPRKSFSIGEARDKRYYLECRAIV